MGKEINNQILDKVNEIYDKLIKLEKHINNPDLEERMQTAEAAEYLGFHKNTLSNMRSLKLGPKYIKVGHLVLYLKKDLDEYLKARVVDPRGGNRKWRS